MLYVILCNKGSIEKLSCLHDENALTHLKNSPAKFHDVHILLSANILKQKNP